MLKDIIAEISGLNMEICSLCEMYKQLEQDAEEQGNPEIIYGQTALLIKELEMIRQKRAELCNSIRE